MGLAGCTAWVLPGCSLDTGNSGDPSGKTGVADADTPKQIAVGQTYPLAWVLSSGGPRGFVHVGVLKALVEMGLKPDLVVGTSVGALVGCLFAAGVDMTRIESLALDANLTSLFRLNLTGEGWINAAGLVDLVNSTIGGKRLQQFPTPFAAVAIEQATDRIAAFNWGNSGLAVHAACAVEGRLAPVHIGGKHYVDADRLIPLPVRLAQSLGAQRVLAIDASAHEDLAPAGTESYRASDLRKREMTRIDARLAQLVLHPDTGYYAGASREYRERSIQAGYVATLQQAPALRALHSQP